MHVREGPRSSQRIVISAVALTACHLEGGIDQTVLLSTQLGWLDLMQVCLFISNE